MDSPLPVTTDNVLLMHTERTREFSYKSLLALCKSKLHYSCGM